MNGKRLDCVVIGYNETPFEQYEEFLRQYGDESEAYRDLKFSFVNVGDQKLNYMGLLNHVRRLAVNGSAGNGTHDEFKSCDIPNLAAAYLTHFLRKRNVEARYINLFQYEKEKLIEYLAQNPLCVAITTTFYVVNFPVSEMVEFIKAHNPQVKVIVGGPLIANHVRNYQSGESAAALSDIGADIYVVEGQGELTLWQIVETLKNGGDLNRVPNIIHFEDGGMKRTATVPENNSLDENYINWLAFPEESLGVTLQTRTARSCAFKCSFCNYPTRAGALTLTSLELIEKELDSMLELGNVQNVVFIDDTFNVPFPRFKDICRMMIRKKYPFNWFSYFRCSNSDEEAIELMAESGCKGVFLGIESGSPTILKNMNKAATIEKYTQGIEWLRRAGILTFGSFIIGFPGETAETVQETIDFLKETKPDYYRAQLWYCEPGTPIEMQRDNFGISGEGFVWSHNKMDSLEAMDHIDRIFLTIKDSIWLPQWSFDFWTIPYLLGRGITLEKFKKLMASAHKLLALEIASVPEAQKRSMQQEYVSSMARLMAD
ncbi:MAG TPA: PhpK family radical SAM P-methyltransferase [Pyrinomonadaceae bacterium]|jgi:p-methyltransferase|nr:PhpK family radical SAM P-methyltransferase [Pyrinomonadaceae bacterium]